MPFAHAAGNGRALFVAILIAVASSQHLPDPVAPTSEASTQATLRSPTGITVSTTPNIKAAAGQRYNGPLNTDPAARPLVHGKYEQLPLLTNVVGVHLAAVPNTNSFLYMERPSSNKLKKFRQIAGKLDLGTMGWTVVDTVNGIFCSGQVQTADGQILVAGGHRETGGFPSGLQGVRLYNAAVNASLLANVTALSWKRWYPSTTLLPDGHILIMGGTERIGGSDYGQPTYELFNPQNPHQYPLPYFNVEPGFRKSAHKLYYPYNFVLPTGDVFSFCERASRVLVAQTGVYRRGPNNKLVAGPPLVGNDFTQFPFTASPAFSKLTYKDNYSSVELMIFGGAPIEAITNNLVMAGRRARRMKISWARMDSNSPWQYAFGNWTDEDLGIPRVMADATLLPNGDVIILNGAQVGISGDGGDSRGNGARANHPNFWAQLYQPDRPLNDRVTMLCASSIARMYHSTAALTINGTILVSGCDRCFKLVSDMPGYKSPLSRFEFRSEIFYPPYYFDFEHKPRITSFNAGSPTLAYNQVFTIHWGAEVQGTSASTPRPPVTSITLVAPSSATHNLNFNQRVVELPILSIDCEQGSLVTRSPPHPYTAAPQWFMLFIMNGKTYSTGRWVRLVDTRGEGKAVPK